jgi:hypothetical protein
MYVHLTRVSSNAKTGPIPVSTTERKSCPVRCPHMNAGCYADSGPLALHWNKIPYRGMPWEDFCEAIAALPAGTLWRHNQAGDLPGDGADRIDGPALMELVEANLGRRGFTYTHYNPTKGDNAYWIAAANAMGFTINLSADTLEQADAYAALGIGPVVVVLPSYTSAHGMTPEGRTVAVCPATQTEGVSCATCQVCAKQRQAIIGFPAHGSRKKVINLRLETA